MRSRYGPRSGSAAAAEFRRGLQARRARSTGRCSCWSRRRTGRGRDRLGLAVSRQVGGAVARNRAKRLLRESFRRAARRAARRRPRAGRQARSSSRCGQAEVDRELRRAPPPRSPARARAGRRALLLLLVEAYRVTALAAPRRALPLRPSCSVYAEEAIRRHGARRGAALAAAPPAALPSVSPPGASTPSLSFSTC